MIKLKKGPVPAFLQSKAAEWTTTLLTKIKRGEQPSKTELSRYNNPEIKSALLVETSGKCAYCESKVTHVTYGDIEHIVPKSVAPEKRYTWSNITIACDVCNTRKSDIEDLLDPYLHEPSEHLTFEGPIAWPLPHSEIAQKTEVVLGLNRLALVERRKERLLALQRLLLLALTHKDPVVRAALRRDIEHNELADGQEYAAMCRTVASRQLTTNC